MTTYYFWLGIFSVLFYLIASDANILYAISLLSRIVTFQYEKQKWWLLHNPSNPIVKYLIWRRSLRIAKQLDKELKDRV